MTQNISRALQQAEIAFAKTQSQFLARTRAAEATDDNAQARQEKTARLKKARLARELEERARVTSLAHHDDGQRPELQVNNTSTGIHI